MERTAIVTFSSADAPTRHIIVTQLAGTAIGPAPGGVTLTFNHNNDTAATSELIRTPGRRIETLPPIPPRQGFSFAGWWTTPITGGVMISVDTLAPNVNTQYWARWTAWPDRTVTFNPNEGNLSQADRTRIVKQGLEVGSLPVPTRPGFTFAGWFTATTGGQQINETRIVLSDITFWARWNPRPYVTVTFNPNGGSIPAAAATTSLRQGQVIGTLPSPNARPNATFVGWYTAPTGGDRVTVNRTINASVTFWARWRVTVTFNSNGGSAIPQRHLNFGDEVGPLPTPTRRGYTFVGWFTASTGGTRVTENTMINTHATYWARWMSRPISLTARIRFDDTARDHNTTEQIISAYNSATAMFRDIFGITIGFDITRDTDLNPTLKAGCTHGVICRKPLPRFLRCGANCYPDHCKSASRKLRVNPTDTEYTLRIVGYLICFMDGVHRDPPTHRSVGGLANVGGRNSIASNLYAYEAGFERTLEWIIQHELGHNFGAWDDTPRNPNNRCSENQRCTMRDRVDVGWLCANCRNDIWQHLLARYG